MHHHLFHRMLNGIEMRIMQLIMIEEIFHYYHLRNLHKKKIIFYLTIKKNLPVNLSIHCRTSAGKNPWYEFACVASIISCKRGGCLKSNNYFKKKFFFSIYFVVRSRWIIDVKVFKADAFISYKNKNWFHIFFFFF